ncbi:methyl-accepting chemotaxis protein [Massilia sp. SR12]
MSWKNLKIGVRLGIGFALLMALMLVIAVASAWRMQQIQGNLDFIVNDNNVKIAAANRMADVVRDVAISVRDMIFLEQDGEIARQWAMIAERRKDYAANAEALQRLVQDDAGKALLARVAGHRNIVVPLVDKAAALGRRNLKEQATLVLLEEVREPQAKWIGAMRELVRYQEQKASEMAGQAREEYAQARNRTFALTAIAIALGSVFAWLITHSITGPLNRAVQVARTVAAGDLSSRVEVTTSEETGKLLDALRHMNENLVRIVADVRAGTETISTASGEIASGNLDLSARTEQQASSLEETASSMEELTSTVKLNADNAHQANRLALSASEVAARGGSVVAQVVETMGSINESSRKIVDIIGVIDSIAFQTNILALNAAVEAARAGEQGRGFAVVASEVRNLAQRSAAAARQVKDLIDSSVEKIDTGSALVGQAGATMEEIVDSIRRVTDIVGEISSATHEQTLGIEQINRAISEMDSVTQQNAALVEEASAAASAMEQQACGLARAVSVFHLGPAPHAGVR